MVNEVAQWLTLLVVILLLVGVLRQVALSLPPEYRTPARLRIGDRLPEEFLARLPRSGNGDQRIVAFVTEACVGCRHLLGSLRDWPDEQRASGLVLAALQPSPAFLRALEESGFPTIAVDQRIWDSCDVTSTPLLLWVDGSGQVTNREVTHRVDAARLSSQSTS